MKRKQGISLIVLSITILVMAILAAAVIISLEDSGIIGRSKNTVKNSNYSDEYTRLAVIKNGILTDNLGTITVEEYVNELKNKGIVNNVIDNPDGSKKATTSSGFDVTIEQDGPSDLNIIIDGYTPPTSANNGGAGGNGSGNNTGKRTFSVMMDETKCVEGEICHIEDLSWYNATNPIKPFTDGMVEFEYEQNMTWREWVNSSYNTKGFKIVVARNGFCGLAGESIVTSGSIANEGKQIAIAYVEVYYSDAACTKIVTDENGIGGCGKVYYGIWQLFSLDEKIETTLNSLQVTVGEFSGKYYKKTPFLAFGYYEW